MGRRLPTLRVSEATMSAIMLQHGFVPAESASYCPNCQANASGGYAWPEELAPGEQPVLAHTPTCILRHNPRTDSQLRDDLMDIIRESELNECPLTFNGMEHAIRDRNGYALDSAHLADLLLALWNGGEIDSVNVEGSLIWRLV